MSTLLASCDRTRSKEARQALRRILWDSAEARKFELPHDCPLLPDADVLQWQEATKRPVSSSHWRCGLCGKNFRSEFFLDKHLARKHATAGGEEALTSVRVEKVCLADFCGSTVPCLPAGDKYIPPVSTVLVRREDEERQDKSQGEGASPEGSGIATPRLCTNRIERMAAKHACFAVIERCVALDGSRPEAEVADFRGYLHGALCDDAPDVECATWLERVAWRDDVLSENAVSTRHTLGWIALLLTVIVYKMGRYMSTLRRGEDDFALPRRRVLAVMRRIRAGKRE